MEHELQGKDYVWWHLEIFTHWSPVTETSTVLIVNLREEVEEFIFDRIAHSGFHEEVKPWLGSAQGPYYVHALLAKAAVQMLRRVGWALRDFIRGKERERQAGDLSKLDSRWFQAGMRHTVHAIQVLEAAKAVVEGMLAAHNRFYDQNRLLANPTKSEWSKDHRQFGMMDHFIIAAFERCIAEFRSLVEHERAQQTRLSSVIQLSIQALVLRDASAMRLLALIGIIFLPATVVSAVFSTSFFYTNNDTNQWAVHGQFWLYWMVTVPITILVGAFSYASNRRRALRRSLAVVIEALRPARGFGGLSLLHWIRKSRSSSAALELQKPIIFRDAERAMTAESI